MPEWDDALIRARQLTQQLEELYLRLYQYGDDLAESREEQKRGFAGLLRGIFPMSQPVEPEHQRFIKNVESLAHDLAQALSQFPQEEQCHELAQRAVSCFLAPKPLEDKTPEEWFMTAAEGYCVPLVPYLTPEDAERFRADMLAHTPKRYLFPKQAEVLKALKDRASH